MIYGNISYDKLFRQWYVFHIYLYIAQADIIIFPIYAY